ncbi:hypothetical protein [Natrononativus amylolyticus]|uniref:hypothetical protein n=1 Tax=Natrononativus amylolyticus TaxID=2963434 RepID=UPI0020CDAB92|nr:hypothetical protein [Natrononativus amylolyticus]
MYEPQDAWRDGSRPYRLTNTGGEVHIDAETGEILAVDITYGMTRAETYADFHLNDNETVTIEITYALDADGGDADEPAWVR